MPRSVEFHNLTRKIKLSSFFTCPLHDIDMIRYFIFAFLFLFLSGQVNPTPQFVGKGINKTIFGFDTLIVKYLNVF